MWLIPCDRIQLVDCGWSSDPHVKLPFYMSNKLENIIAFMFKTLEMSFNQSATCLICWVGCPNIHSSQGINVPLKYVIMYGIIMHYLNFQSFPLPFTIRKLNSKYTKEILENTREKAFWSIFCFFTLKTSF